MKCPKCQFENREGVKFCEECGSKFELECPACKANIPIGRKFCGECGHNFSITPEPLPKELSFDEKLTKIQKYLPKGLTEKILSQRDRIEGERKQVTVMFCDMEGFTPMSEMLGIEEAYSIIDQVALPVIDMLCSLLTYAVGRQLRRTTDGGIQVPNAEFVRA
jgi:hypothetical protein